MVITSDIHFKYPDYGENHIIWAYKCLHSFTYPHYYEYSISLSFPEMPSNFEQGVFMIKLILLDDKIDYRDINPKYIRYLELKSNRITEKPMILKYQNEWYRTIKTFVYAFPRLISEFFGFNIFEETQRLSTVFVDHFQSNPSTYEQCLLVTINNPKVYIYDAKITARVKLDSFKYIFYSWFFTSSFISILLMSWFLSFFILSLYLYRKWIKYRMLKRLREMEEEEEENDEGSDEGSWKKSDEDDKKKKKIDIDDSGLLMEDDEEVHKQIEKFIDEMEESKIIDINEMEEEEEEEDIIDSNDKINEIKEEENDEINITDKNTKIKEEEDDIISNILFQEHDHPIHDKLYNTERKSIVDEAYEFIKRQDEDPYELKII